MGMLRFADEIWGDAALSLDISGRTSVSSALCYKGNFKIGQKQDATPYQTFAHISLD
jgi:hypothetical protein